MKIVWSKWPETRSEWRVSWVKDDLGGRILNFDLGHLLVQVVFK
jgi:hypothetical protein